MIRNLKIDSNTIADHFIKHFSNKRSARQSLSKIKEAYKINKFNSWVVYVKAYNFDIDLQFKNESTWEAQTANVLDITKGSIEPKMTISKNKQLENAEREKDMK